MTSSTEYIRLHGHSDDYEPSPATEPCGHPAGSLGRVESYTARAEAGQELWHPRDCQATASAAESQAMSNEVIRVARKTKYAKQRGS